MLCRYPVTFVCDGNDNAGAANFRNSGDFFDRDADARLIWTVFHSIVDQIMKHFRQLVTITGHEQRRTCRR